MNNFNKTYKTIGEVTKMLNLIDKKTGKLLTHTLRYWEKEFKQVKPIIFSGKRRYYDDKAIDILKKIQYLLKDKGMTINGVKKALNSENSNIDDLHITTINQKKIIKSKLNKIKYLIDNIREK